MSGVLTPMPAQNSFKPPPEPVDSTTGVLKSVFLPKRSETAVANGKTVEDPTMLIWSRANDVELKAVASSAVAANANVGFLYVIEFLRFLAKCAADGGLLKATQDD